jgi:hypothetical protein
LRISILLCATVLLASCTAAGPTAPAARGPEPPASANGAPVIAGEDRCIGPEGTVHVFDLVLTDPDGDRLSWRAWTERQGGRLAPIAGSGLASGATIRIVYTPEAGRDENTIVLVVTDARGASATKTLYVRSG